MNVRWMDQAQLRVEVVDEVSRRSFPADRRIPEWLAIMAAVEAGTLIIQPFVPPQPQTEAQS